MIKEPRLRFTDEERANPALEKPIRKADKAAAKADRAQAKIPKKKVRQVEIDQETGKTTTKLVLEDKKKPPSKLSHTLRDAPANMVAGKIHKEVRESEQDNVGVESAHKSEEAVETGARLVREGYHSWKRPMSAPCIRSLCRKIPSLPAIPFPAGSRSRPSKSSMQPLNTPVRLLGILPKLHRPPERPPGQ